MNFDWDDLRVFLAAARSGSLTNSAKRLSIDTATVGRRIARLESALKSTLLIRSAGGLQLTAAGAQLLDIATDAERAMESAARIGQTDVVGGTVRISAAEGFGTMILAPALPEFVRRRSQLKIELAALPGFLSPTRREVDMAITLGAPDTRRLVVEPLTPYELGIFAAPQYVEKVTPPERVEELLSHKIVGYIDDMLYAPELRYLDEILPGLTPHLSSSSIRAQREIISCGGGIGVLPCFMASGLTRLLPTQVKLKRQFWLSIHREIATTARIRAVTDWLRTLVEKQGPLLNPNS